MLLSVVGQETMEAMFSLATTSSSGMNAVRIQGFGGGEAPVTQEKQPYSGIFSKTSGAGFNIGAEGTASPSSYRGANGRAMGGYGNPNFESSAGSHLLA